MRPGYGPIVAAYTLLFVGSRGSQVLPGSAEDSGCEVDEADLMQRSLRAATQNGQGPFTGPGSVAHAMLYPDLKKVPWLRNKKAVEFDCKGDFYRFRFEGGYGQGEWCLTEHHDGLFTKAEATTALNYDALYRSGLELGPLDWYGYMRENMSYSVSYDADRNLKLKELGPCSPSAACATWKNPSPTDGEKNNGFAFPPYVDVAEASAPRTKFTGIWCNVNQVNKPQYPQCKVDSTAPDAASVFGAAGFLKISTAHTMLRIPHIVDIDLMNTTLPLYGASLVPHGETLPAPIINVTLLSYSFAPSFLDKWVYDKDGPGMFLEHHLFTHYFMNPDQDIYPGQNGMLGATISLARQVNASEDCQGKSCDYWITAFSVPSGYTIHCPPGCIHEDWTNLGKEVTSLADYVEAEKVQDNTVYLRNEHSGKIRLSFQLTGSTEITIGKDIGRQRGEVTVEKKDADGKIAVKGEVQYGKEPAAPIVGA